MAVCQRLKVSLVACEHVGNFHIASFLFIVITNMAHERYVERRGENKAIKHSAHPKCPTETCTQIHYSVIVLLPVIAKKSIMYLSFDLHL